MTTRSRFFVRTNAAGAKVAEYVEVVLGTFGPELLNFLEIGPDLGVALGNVEGDDAAESVRPVEKGAIGQCPAVAHKVPSDRGPRREHGLEVAEEAMDLQHEAAVLRASRDGRRK